MDIKTIVDLKMLQEIQDRFSVATGLAAITVDADGNYITEGSNFTNFCMKYTRGNQEGLRRCIKCDTEGKGTYFCHAGLMDFASDIIVDGQRVGAIIGGQVLPHEPDLEKFKGIARELGVDENAYLAALKEVPIRSEKVIRAAADMLAVVVNQLVNLEYFKRVNARKVEVFDVEIKHTTELIGKVHRITSDLQKIATMESILSLNASVEAAHAGNAGVGFAVVAAEIQSLSQSSSAIYQEIGRLVDDIKISIQTMANVKI